MPPISRGTALTSTLLSSFSILGNLRGAHKVLTFTSLTPPAKPSQARVTMISSPGLVSRTFCCSGSKPLRVVSSLKRAKYSALSAVGGSPYCPQLTLSDERRKCDPEGMSGKAVSTIIITQYSFETYQYIRGSD